MNLKGLIGKRFLDAVDFSEAPVKMWDDEYENCSVCNFRLDGNVYSAIEDPSDGYRSSMRELVINANTVMKNEFPAIEVVARYVDRGEYQEVSDILELIDTTTGKVVLRVGTENTEDYYPYYVADFSPEAMVTNL